MKTFRRLLNLQTAYPLQKLAPMEQLLFFDIETTGFLGGSSFLYLIGCLFYHKEKKSWELLQWLADTPESEPEILSSFFTHLQQFSTVIHFNGDTFDCPFLMKRCRHYHLSYDFSQKKSIDIYQKARPFQQLLKLDSMKQKSVEQFLQFHRTDRYQGRQLIKLYFDYQITQSQALCQLLLLHNEDDLKGMFHILPILAYSDMVKSEVRLVSRELLFHDSLSNSTPKKESDVPDKTETNPELSLTLTLTESVGGEPYPFPAPFRMEGTIKGSFITGQDVFLICRVPLYEGELKLFYPDYKNYYYLPYEDMAVHKSIGAYVSKTARVKASAKTCYTRQSGLFLPQKAPLWQPAFQKEYRDAVSYVPYQENLFDDAETAAAYLRQLFPLYGQDPDAGQEQELLPD